MKDDLNEYRELVQRLIKQPESRIINNASRAHAKVILQEFFRVAKKRIVIQCSHLAGDVYGDEGTQCLLDEACYRGVKLDIAIRDKSPQSPSLYARLRDKRDVSIRCGKSVFPVDFCVVDGEFFRLEKDQPRGQAYVGVHELDISAKLEGIFDGSVMEEGLQTPQGV